jgi:CheY-like chemotaxis protein
MALALQSVRILLVEDDPIIGLDLRHTLEAAGAVVMGPAHDVPGALALLESSSVDVGVLDNLIIGGDSLPIADMMAQQGGRSCSIPVIAAICENDIRRFRSSTSHRGRANWSGRFRR